MLPKDFKLPLYAKTTIYLVGFFTLFAILYITQGIIVPLIFSIIFAIILNPVVNIVVRLRINRVVAITITLTLFALIFATLGTLLVGQVSRFSESLPILTEKFTRAFNQLAVWSSGYFDINLQKINTWINHTKEGIINNSGEKIGHTLASVGSGLVLLFLIPVYMFMILFYRPLLLEFFRRLFGKSNRMEVSKVIKEIKALIQRYLLGLLLEVTIIAALYTTGLLILGIEYAIMLGIMGALLNLIPYIGSIIAASIPMMIALVTKSSPWYVILVLAMYIFIQLVDNNYIVPKLVGSKVKINALVTIMAVIAFSALWGIPGMFLSIPLTAIVKLICDHIDSLEAWGFLLGDNMPPTK